MLIKRFLHSCITIEENEKRLLIDPGRFCFAEKKFKPEDVGGLDAILITHAHSDHYDIDALKNFLLAKNAKIITNDGMATVLKENDIECGTINPGTETLVEGFKVKAFDAPHGHMPVPSLPTNYGYLINNELLHTGDSLQFRNVRARILCVPFIAPWLTVDQAVDFVNGIRPEIVVPVHDYIMKDFMVETVYKLVGDVMAGNGIKFQNLVLGDRLEVR